MRIHVRRNPTPCRAAQSAFRTKRAVHHGHGKGDKGAHKYGATASMYIWLHIIIYIYNIHNSNIFLHFLSGASIIVMVHEWKPGKYKSTAGVHSISIDTEKILQYFEKILNTEIYRKHSYESKGSCIQYINTAVFFSISYLCIYTHNTGLVFGG